MKNCLASSIWSLNCSKVSITKKSLFLLLALAVWGGQVSTVLWDSCVGGWEKNIKQLYDRLKKFDWKFQKVTGNGSSLDYCGKYSFYAADNNNEYDGAKKWRIFVQKKDKKKVRVLYENKHADIEGVSVSPDWSKIAIAVENVMSILMYDTAKQKIDNVFVPNGVSEKIKRLLEDKIMKKHKDFQFEGALLGEYLEQAKVMGEDWWLEWVTFITNDIFATTAQKKLWDKESTETLISFVNIKMGYV